LGWEPREKTTIKDVLEKKGAVQEEGERKEEEEEHIRGRRGKNAFSRRPEVVGEILLFIQGPKRREKNRNDLSQKTRGRD